MKQIKLPKGKAFEFKKATTTSKYAWDSYFDGNVNMLTKTKVDEAGAVTEAGDYTVETDAMLPKIKTAARRRYKVVQTSRFDHEGKRLEDAIILQARDMNDDEKAAEDLKRAEEKAAGDEAPAEEKAEEPAAEAAA